MPVTSEQRKEYMRKYHAERRQAEPDLYKARGREYAAKFRLKKQTENADIRIQKLQDKIDDIKNSKS